MANIIREVLTAPTLNVTLFTGGMSRIGFNILGTWTGTITFLASNDGVNFKAVSVVPWIAGGTTVGAAVQSTTTNGSWERSVENFVAFRVIFAATGAATGSPTVVMATSVDSSYQDAFLTAATKFVNSVKTHAVNTLTQAAQGNRAWRLRTLVISVSGVATWATNPVWQVQDGVSSSTVLWAGDLPTALPGAPGAYNIPLPADPNTPGLSGGGIVGTPGNAMTIIVADGGSGVITNINAEFTAA